MSLLNIVYAKRASSLLVAGEQVTELGAQTTPTTTKNAVKNTGKSRISQPLQVEVQTAVEQAAVEQAAVEQKIPF